MRAVRPELESNLRTLFDRQARAIQPSLREWGDEPVVNVVDLETEQEPKRRLVAAVVALVVVLGAAVGVVDRHASTVRTGSGAGVSSEVHWSTPQVSLSAASFSIDVGGKQFIAADPNISIHSDPGDSKYQTLELEWVEHGVPMRWYIYFASDGKDWWSNEMRTYDASTGGEWVPFGGTFFRSPLGTPFVGDVNLTATDHGVSSHLQVTGLHLQAFRLIGSAQGQPPRTSSGDPGPVTVTTISPGTAAPCQVGQPNPPSCGG